MPRTLLPRSALRNSSAVTANAPVDPAVEEKIVGPASEPTSEPTSQPATQPASQPSTKPGPVDPNPQVLLVHPPSVVLGPGLRGDAEGPIFARDPLGGAATLVVEYPIEFPLGISPYSSIGRLVIFLRKIPDLYPWSARTWKRYRGYFDGKPLPVVTGSVEFEAPNVIDEVDIEALVDFAKIFKAPTCTMWNYGHGAETMALATRGKKEKAIDLTLEPHRKFLLERTPSAADIVTIASALPYFEVAAEWFDPKEDVPDPPRPKSGVLRRSQGVTVKCNEGDYSKVNFNVGAKLQRIEVTVNLSIPPKP